MAITIVNNGLNQEKGVTYSAITDSSIDWTGITNNTYFYDKNTDLPYYKNASGTVISLFEEGGTDTNDYTTGTTLVGTTLYFDRTDSLSAYTADLSSIGGGSSDAVTLDVQKDSSGTINVGDVVRLADYDVGEGVTTVELVDPSTGTTMPAIGIATSTITQTTTGTIVTHGKADGLNTSLLSLGDVYVSPTSGELTNIKPTGTTLVQKFGQVTRVNASNGEIIVFGAGRENDLPNLGTDKLWIGDANGIPVEIDKSALASTPLVVNLRVPTETEWENERLSWSSNNSAGAFASPLRLPMAGVRSLSSGSLNDVGTFGFYWSSTVSGTTASRLRFSSSDASMGTRNRAHGRSVRLIVDGTFTQAEFNENYLGKTIVYLGLTYGFVYNSSTQKIWLDRNLGATQVAVSSTDANSYGDLYQWGRFGDGHQSRTSPTHNGDTLGKPSTATSSGAWDGKFITTGTSPYDWLSAQDNTLWQGTFFQTLAKLPNSITLNKTFTLESPTASDNITIFRTDVDITVQEVILVSTGTSPSTNYVLKFSSNRSAVGTNLTLSGTTTSTSTGDVATLSTATIPANSWIWLETTAASGTNVYLTIDIRFS